MAARRKYGPVQKISDISRINSEIRSRIPKAKSSELLRRLQRESMYLFTLSKTDAWKKNFPGEVIKLRNKIKSEYTKTANAINKRARVLKLKYRADTKIG